MLRRSVPTLSALLLIAVAVPAAAQAGGDAEKGKAFVEEKCARCHAVGREGESPLAKAPPFRTLSSLYPLDSLEESLAEGIVTGHPDMPEFELEPEEISDLIAWLEEISK